MSTNQRARNNSFLSAAAWVMFCLTSLQIAFLRPYVSLVPNDVDRYVWKGDWTNALSSILCVATLVLALVAARKGPIRATIPEIIISAALVTLAALSSIFSASPEFSSAKTFALVAPSLAGFWCARLVLNDQYRQSVFVWLGMGILAGLIVLNLRSYVTTGNLSQNLYSNPHALVSMLALLTFAPLALLSRATMLQSLLAAGFLVLTSALFYLCNLFGGVQSGLMIPMVMIVIVSLGQWTRSRWWWVMLVLIMLGAGVTGNFFAYVTKQSYTGTQFENVRIENYAFSWHIAKKHPWLGVGLGSPEKVNDLEDYEVRNPVLREGHKYANHIKHMPTSTMDSIFLTFLSDLGLPFLVLYVFAVVSLLVRLIRTALRPLDESALHPLVLLLPIAGVLVHSVVDDTLIYPQVCWFFHILLGLSPLPLAHSARIPVQWKRVFLKAAAITGVVALGLFIGTHPLFKPGDVGLWEKISLGFKELPLVALLYKVETEPHVERGAPDKVGKGRSTQAGRGKTAAPAASSSAGKPGGASISRPSEQRARAEKQRPALIKEQRLPGKLIVKIKDYQGEEVRWSLMVILDNSETMVRETEPWRPSRFRAAVDLLNRINHNITDGSQMAVRSFSSSFSLTKDGREFPVNVSQVLLNWTRCPIAGLPDTLERIVPCRQTNPCVAADRSITTDFTGEAPRVPRVLILTDGEKQCSVNRIMSAITREDPGPRPLADIVLFPSGATHEEGYAELARKSGGFFARIDSPSDLASTAPGYCSVLKTPRRGQIIVQDDKTTRKVLPDEEITLPEGTYELLMPRIGGVAASDLVIRDVTIRSGVTTHVDVSVHDGNLKATSFNASENSNQEEDRLEEAR